VVNVQPLIRHFVPADGEAIARIYNYYIGETIITFEEESISPTDITGRAAEISGASLPWLVVEESGSVIGYAYASKWKGRCAYRHSVETTIYLDRSHIGRGIGRLLYAALLKELATRPVHVAIGGIALPNAASVKLHECVGFVKVAHFKEVGFKFKQWIDVGYWQKTLGDSWTPQ